jgi:cysteine desulfurase
VSERVYLDWNATAPLRPEARLAALAALDARNPSSVHGEGRAARRMIEDSRELVAGLVGARTENVVFTASGSEANALALTPTLGDVLLVSAGEHASVRSGGRFPLHAIETIPLTADGIVDLADLSNRIATLKAKGRRALVSIMHANNETGAIQPIAEAATLVHDADWLLHVDAVQSAGRLAVDLRALGADLLTLSAHKLGGPKGAGALVWGEGVEITDPLVRGGGQERGRRAGTENVSAIAGFGAAARAVRENMVSDAARMRSLRDRLETDLQKARPVVIFSQQVPRLPNTSLFAFKGLKAETALIALDLDGVAVSSGAACSSGKVAPSHVLAAMGISPALAASAIRISIGATTTAAEIDLFLRAWIRLAASLSNESGLAA